MRRMLGERATAVLVLRSTSADHTIALGRRLGVLLQPGDVVLLFAPFGAGKTHLTKGIAAAWGVDPDDVNSPSFVLVNQYDSAPKGYPAHRRTPIFHADLYRVESPDDVATVGLEDLLDARGLVIVEWAEHAAGFVPAEHLAIHIEIVNDSERVLRLHAHGARYEQLLDQVRATSV
jgi:tRNA threonylcarbamoyladenosine biosynthesis protein TsaE